MLAVHTLSHSMELYIYPKSPVVMPVHLRFRSNNARNYIAGLKFRPTFDGSMYNIIIQACEHCKYIHQQ